MKELTPEQERELIADLRSLHQQLLSALSDGDRHEVVDLDLPIGRLSRVDALQQQSMAKAERQRTEQRLEQVEAALERVEDGEYGYCCLSGEPIGYKRLKARPEAPFSVASQEKLEREGSG
ncbi:MAG: TraR/DksA family transcriptional regulator [Myxococcota bacterium]|nr:TraR/DksA family transcriptional regulator [Myxococcota bacterium]